MHQEDLLYYLALQRANGVGDINAKKLIAHCGSARAVFKEKDRNLENIPGIGSFILKGLRNKSLLKDAEQELNFIEENHIRAYSFLEEDYPDKLKHCVDGPMLLFQKGNISLQGRRIISIVGTRQMTNYGRLFLEKFIPELKKHNPVIISGLAYGVDIFAHRLAMQYNLQTIGILAHGLDTVYPKVHLKDAGNMMYNGGLITDFWSKTTPDKENFVKRNRIVAGLSEATIVVESKLRGGSLITADIANSYHRDVFAVPGRVSDTYSEGCNQFIKSNRAAMLTTVKDLEYILNWETEGQKQKSVQKQLFVDLVDEEKMIYDFLLKEGKKSLDTIALHCKFPIQKTAGLLFNLEIKGVTKPLPGKIFEAI